MRTPTRLFTAILVASLPLSSALAADSASATKPHQNAPELHKGPLAPEHLQAIQGIGRAVLYAQQSQSPDPELAALNQEVLALSQTLDRAMANKLGQPPVPVNPVSAKKKPEAPKKPQMAVSQVMNPGATYNVVRDKDGQFVTQEVIPTPPTKSSLADFIPNATMARGVVTTGADPYVQVRQHLSQVVARVQQYTSAAAGHGGEERAIQAQGLADKVVQLHDELQAVLDDTALNGASSDSTSKLIALRERLHPQNRAVQSASTNPDQQEAENPTPTPTLTSLARHR